jgi:ABC-type glycerol-3-phosphate transport system substrate-binding protein
VIRPLRAYGKLIPILLCLSLLHGCERGRAEANRVVEITVWSMWTGQEEQNFERVLRRYEQLHPHIRIRNLGAVGDDTKTVRAIVAGVPPDFCTLSDPSYLGPLARNHAIRPLDSLFRQTGLHEADFVPASLGLCRYGGQLYGMPFLIDDKALMWDKDAFRVAGLDPERPPRTLEELTDYAVKLTKHDRDGKLVTLGLRPPSMDDIYAVCALYNGRFTDPQTGRITADAPGNTAGLDWNKQLVERMGGNAEVNAFKSGFGRDMGASNPFFTGKVAMQFCGEWTPYWVARFAPQMRYGVAPVPPPAARPENAGITWIGGNVFCIPAESRHPQEAWDFMVWMQSTEAQVMFAHDMYNVPNARAALKSPVLRTGQPFRARYALYLDMADDPRAGYFPVTPVASLYMNQLSTATDQVLFGDKTSQQALTEVRLRVQKELDHQ